MVNETKIAYMCPACENINIFHINIFSFSGNRTKICECGCGHSQIKLVKNSNKSIKTDMICPVCNENHSFVIPSNQFWSSESFSFPCTYYEATSFIIGKGDKLEEALKEYITNELEEEVSYDTPDINTLDKVAALIEDIGKNPDKYFVCNCNSSVSTAYNEKSLYIICDKCGLSKKISYDSLKN